MESLDRKEEIAELKRVLNPKTPSKFVVVFGRRRGVKGLSRNGV